MIIEEIKQRGILIIDDDDFVTKSLMIVFKRLGYKNVRIYLSPLDALSFLSSDDGSIYLILLDIRMPEMSGISLFEHLVNHHKYPIGVKIITAYADVNIASTFFKLGNNTIIADDFFLKPLEIDPLFTSIDRTLEAIYKKRLNYREFSENLVYDKLINIEKSMNILKVIEDEVKFIKKMQKSFLENLGLDIIRAIVLALGIFSLLYFGIGDFIRNILN